MGWTSRYGATTPEAVDGVVVHHSSGLHEGITDRRPHEAEFAPPEITAEARDCSIACGRTGSIAPAGKLMAWPLLEGSVSVRTPYDDGFPKAHPSLPPSTRR